MNKQKNKWNIKKKDSLYFRYKEKCSKTRKGEWKEESDRRNEKNGGRLNEKQMKVTEQRIQTKDKEMIKKVNEQIKEKEKEWM